MAATATADVDHALTVCQANMNEQQVFTQCKKLNTFEDYAGLTDSEVSDLASKFK